MMTNWMVLIYEMVTAADAYWFGFFFDGKVYLVKDIPFAVMARFFREDHASSKKGGAEKIRIRARVDDLRSLLPMAVCLGDASVMDYAGMKNVGEKFERLITERFTGREWVKDSTPFWVAGDVEIDGKQIQVKFNEATLVTSQALKKNFPDLVRQ